MKPTEAESLLNTLVETLLSTDRIIQVNKHHRTFILEDGTHVRGVEPLVRAWQKQYSLIEEEPIGRLKSQVGRLLNRKLGYLYHKGKNRVRAIGKEPETIGKSELAQLARKELKSRLASMSVKELAALARE